MAAGNIPGNETRFSAKPGNKPRSDRGTHPGSPGEQPIREPHADRRPVQKCNMSRRQKARTADRCRRPLPRGEPSRFEALVLENLQGWQGRADGPWELSGGHPNSGAQGTRRGKAQEGRWFRPGAGSQDRATQTGHERRGILRARGARVVQQKVTAVEWSPSGARNAQSGERSASLAGQAAHRGHRAGRTAAGAAASGG